MLASRTLLLQVWFEPPNVFSETPQSPFVLENPWGLKLDSVLSNVPNHRMFGFFEVENLLDIVPVVPLFVVLVLPFSLFLPVLLLFVLALLVFVLALLVFVLALLVFAEGTSGRQPYPSQRLQRRARPFRASTKTSGATERETSGGGGGCPRRRGGNETFSHDDETLCFDDGVWKKDETTACCLFTHYAYKKKIRHLLLCGGDGVLIVDVARRRVVERTGT